MRCIERRDHALGQVLRHWLSQQVIPAFQDKVFDIAFRVALAPAALHVPDPRPERDALIAATALVHGYGVTTRNVADFHDLRVTILNPRQERVESACPPRQTLA